MSTIDNKKCTKCLETKDLDLFYKNKSKKNNYDARCIECTKQYAKEYRKNNSHKIKKWKNENREKIQQYNKKYDKGYYQQNKEHITKRNNKYKEDHREWYLEYYKTYNQTHSDIRRINKHNYYQNNKEMIKIQSKKYANENPEKMREYKKKHKAKFAIEYKKYYKEYQQNNRGKVNNINSKRRAALLKASPIWLSDDQWKEIEWFYLTAQELQWLSEEPLHVDHIIPLQGKDVCGLHVPWNLQILPKTLNLKKGNRI